MKNLNVFATIIVLLQIPAIVFSQPNHTSMKLQEYVVSHLFYEYDMNDFFGKPVQVYDGRVHYMHSGATKNQSFRVDEFEYLLAISHDTGDKKIAMIDFYNDKNHKAGIIDSTKSLLGRVMMFYYTGKMFKNVEKAQDFINPLLAKESYDVKDVERVLGRKIHFFDNIDQAYKTINEVLPMMENCEGGIKFLADGITLCPDATAPRTIYYKKFKGLKVMDLDDITWEREDDEKDYIFLNIDRQFDEKDNATLKDGESTFMALLYKYHVKQRDDLYKLVDAFIYLASY